MTLENMLLEKLASWRPEGEGRHVLHVADESSGWAVTLCAERQDAVGCALWELQVRRSSPLAAVEAHALGTWAERVAGRVTGLLEPLRLLEVDDSRCEALLRSDDPAQRGEGLFYYEVLLRGTRQATVRRYRATHNHGRREQVPFALTHEVLARLAADLTAE